MSDDDLYKMLGAYGVISAFHVNRENGTGMVTYSNIGVVHKAIQGLNGRKLDDQTFFISETIDKKRKAATYNNLYVGNVDPNVTEKEIREVFEKYGEIESLLIPARTVINDAGEKQSIRKNHIFIAFKDSKVASNVIKELDQRYIWNRNLDIDYYDNDRKKLAAAKKAPATGISSAQTQDLMNVMMNAFSMALSNMRGGRGGFGPSSNSGGYRGNSNSSYNNRGPRASRGTNRGTRGGRGGPRGAPPSQYNVRSQYENKQMMPSHMAPPPMTSMQPPMPPMQPPMAPMGLGSSIAAPSHFGGPVHQPLSMSPQVVSQTPAPMVAQSHSQVPSTPNPDAFNVSMHDLETMDSSERDNCLGTYFYNRLEVTHGQETAGKIAGMFLDLPFEEVYQIATAEEIFQKYVSDALELIKKEGEDQQE